MANTSSKNSLVFFGNERMATGVTTTAPALTALLAAGYKIEAVFAGHADSKSRQKRDLEIGPVAHAHNIPVILAGTKENLATKVKRHPAEAAVLVAFGQIIPSEVISMFPKGIINIHPSLLPQYRGPTPIESAILDGATKTGVSLMKITDGMDEGPLYKYKTFRLNGTESKQQLAESLLALGTSLLIESLPSILNGKLQPKAQPHPHRATYTKKISKKDGEIDWNKPAAQIEREVRAYLGWPGSYTSFSDKKIIITKAGIRNQESGIRKKNGEWFETDDKKLAVKASKDVLIIEKVKPAGKSEMSGQEFIRGYLS